MASSDSAQQPTSVPLASSLANVEDLAGHRARLLHARPPTDAQRNRQNCETAVVLVLDDRFPYCASIEVNDLHWVRAQFSSRTRDQLIATVRKILCQEFGRNRVKRNAFHFEVRHGNIDKLIKCMVQVQFYTNQILLPEYNLLGERNELNGISITWGVGRNLSQAVKDRIRKRNQKYSRR